MATTSWKDPPRQLWPLVRTDGGCVNWSGQKYVHHYPALLKGLYEASAYSFLHRAEKGPWKASAHTDFQKPDRAPWPEESHRQSTGLETIPVDRGDVSRAPRC